MENTKGKKWNPTKKSGGKKKACQVQPVETEGKLRAAGEPSTARSSGKETKRKRTKKDDKGACPQKMAQDKKRVRIRKKIPVPPLPVKLPPVNLLHRDTVRAWCQQLKLGTKGLKLEAYRRLCEYAYPHQKAIPVTPKESKILTKSQLKLKMERGEMIPGSLDLLEGTAVPEEWVSSVGGATALLEQMSSDIDAVTTSTPDAVFASWSRIAARSGKMEAMTSPQEASGVKWCVVHGQSLPAVTEGWVKLQFYAGQAWVPEEQGKVCALFLLPSCSLPPPDLEDNMLCPKCIHSFKEPSWAPSGVLYCPAYSTHLVTEPQGSSTAGTREKLKCGGPTGQGLPPARSAWALGPGTVPQTGGSRCCYSGSNSACCFACWDTDIYVFKWKSVSQIIAHCS